MGTKLLVGIIAVFVLVFLLSGCKKVKKEVLVQDTPLSYYTLKMNGSHNWSGTYRDEVNNYTRDTNCKFVLKRVSDSVIVAYVANSADTLLYYETNEIEKTIFFRGVLDNSVNSYWSWYSIYLTYYYADDHITYTAYLDKQQSSRYYVELSVLVLHSP